MKIPAVLIASLLIASPLFSASKIPEQINVGDYSISLKLPDTWRVEVFESKGRVVYRYLETQRTGKLDENVGAQIEVLKLILPFPKEEISIEKFVDKIVQEDPLEYRMAVFGDRYTMVPYLESKKVAGFGFTKHFIANGKGRAIRVTAVIKARDRNSLALYLITGLENSETNAVNPVWLGKIDEIVEGLKEIKNAKPDSTATPPPAK